MSCRFSKCCLPFQSVRWSFWVDINKLQDGRTNHRWIIGRFGCAQQSLSQMHGARPFIIIPARSGNVEWMVRVRVRNNEYIPISTHLTSKNSNISKRNSMLYCSLSSAVCRCWSKNVSIIVFHLYIQKETKSFAIIAAHVNCPRPAWSVLTICYFFWKTKCSERRRCLALAV